MDRSLDMGSARSMIEGCRGIGRASFDRARAMHARPHAHPCAEQFRCRADARASARHSMKLRATCVKVKRAHRLFCMMARRCRAAGAQLTAACRSGKKHGAARTPVNAPGPRGAPGNIAARAPLAAAKAWSQDSESMRRSHARRARFTETSHRAGILEIVPDSLARRKFMRRVAFVVVLCAAAFVAACSDDAPHDAHATDASQQSGGSAGPANAFNSEPSSANAAASDAAPLAPPVVHYPPDDDDDAKPAADASASGAAASGAAASPSH
nr:hypothetical protein [Burkholderia pseudomultivorans]